MFKVGDILKTNMAEAENQYEGCRGTTVYRTLMKRAETYRFEVIGVTGGEYRLRRLSDGQENNFPKGTVHSDLVLAEDKDESDK